MPRYIEIEVGDVELLFRELFELQKSGDYFFRGISKEAHYSPSLFREFKNYKPADNEDYNVWNYEIEILEKFAQYSVQYLPSIITPLDWVATAQHYGLPTRLLDWTFDPFCSLYFSVFYNLKEQLNNDEEEDDDYYQLLVVNKKSHLYYKDVPIFKSFDNDPESHDTNYDLLKEYIILVRGLSLHNRHDLGNYARGTYYSREKKFAREIKAEIDNNNETTKLFFCSINHSNPRIIAQNGLFQIPRKVGYGGEKGNLKDDIVNGCGRIYKIHRRCRQDILARLSNMNIDSIRLFPDLQNICDYIKHSTNNKNFDSSLAN